MAGWIEQRRKCRYHHWRLRQRLPVAEVRLQKGRACRLVLSQLVHLRTLFRYFGGGATCWADSVRSHLGDLRYISTCVSRARNFQVLAFADGITFRYASEVCPLALRGYLTCYVNLCWCIGQLVAAGVLYGCLKIDNSWAYRIAYAVQWAWPVPLMAIIWFAPESPWLVQ